MKKISCRFLQRAIYFAPDELRHCCKRFFYNGKLKGDVSIFPVSSNEDYSLEKIINAKKNIIEKINQGEETECSGCPVLESKEWLNIEEEKIDLISIENHSRCNMRCVYCSDTYYGGKIANYDLLTCLEELVKNNKIANNLQVSWGGGEPTMTKDFEQIVDYVTLEIKPKIQRFFSNAINYSEKIESLLHDNIASLTTSVDAGTSETFKTIRGVRQYKRVLKNLKKYFDASAKNVIIKYIFTEKNSTIEEISNFASSISQIGLGKS